MFMFPPTFFLGPAVAPHFFHSRIATDPCARNGLFKGYTKKRPNGRFCVGNHRSRNVSKKI